MRATVFSYPDAAAAIGAAAFTQVSASSAPRSMPLPNGREAWVSAVDAAFFPMLGTRMAAGRGFDATEGEPGSGRAVCVVSYAFWTRELGSRPIADLSTTIAARTYAVIGITAPGFTGIDLDPTDVWVPFGIAVLGRGEVNGVEIPWYRLDNLRSLRVIGRLVSAGAGPAATERVGAALAARDASESRPERKAELIPIVPAGGAAVNQQSQRILGRLTIVAAIVLVIASANAMHLLLARGLRRQREIATRLAVGASRARIARLLLVESLVLAAAGAGAAALFGAWTSDALQRLIFPDGRWTTAWLDARTSIFTAVLALAAGVAAGLVPAWQSTASDVVSALKAGRLQGNRRARRTRSSLLIAQTAMSLALLAASGLLVRSLLQLNAVELGFDSRGLVMATVSDAVRGDGRDARALAERLRAGEQIGEVALTSAAPFGAQSRTSMSVPGSSYEPDSQLDAPMIMAVSPEFFQVMRTPVLEGRTFSPADGAEPVVVVNASMARNYWGPSLPPGACVLVHGKPCARVIGVVADFKEAPGEKAPMRFFVPLESGWNAPRVVLARVDAAAAPALVARIKALLPPTPRPSIEVVSDRLARALRPWRTSTQLFVALGAVALALACIGIYSVMSYGASERVQEVGVRIALGATASDVRRLLVGEGLRLTLVGAVLGLGAAVVVGRLLESLLFAVSPFDPWAYVLALVAMLVAALTAMLPPSLRASRTDAVVALRQE
jgi:predicted permease